jgi:hypothetical protein
MEHFAEFVSASACELSFLGYVNNNREQMVTMLRTRTVIFYCFTTDQFTHSAVYL